MKSWILALVAVVLAGCGEKTTGPATPSKGWRSAGLEAPGRGMGDEQWEKLTVAGERLLAMNSLGGMFVSAAYSGGWTKIPWTEQGTPYEFTALRDTLWVGTEKPGRLYAARIGEWQWKPVPLGISDSFTVYGLHAFRSELVVMAAKYLERHFFLRSAQGWISWDSGYPMASSARMLDVGDTLWSATWESGLWYRVWGEPSWKNLPAPRATWLRDSVFNPRGLAWHEGSLWIGDYGNEMTRATGGRAPFRAYRNCAGGANNGIGCKEIPLNIYTALEHRGRLFVSGHFPASGFVWDDSSGFFLPMAEGWCWNDLADCGGLQTRDLVGLGDTLYAAGSRFIMKFPLSDLPVFSKENAAVWKWNLDPRWRDSLWALPNPVP